jgi:hypothetical protein
MNACISPNSLILFLFKEKYKKCMHFYTKNKTDNSNHDHEQNVET